MNAKTVILGALGCLLCGLGSAFAQDSPYPTVSSGLIVASDPDANSGATLSNWITYSDKTLCCDGPTGRNGPIMMELFLRSGPSHTHGEEELGKQLRTGWMIDFGAKALFFNPEVDAAWVMGASVSNANNRSDDTVSRQNPFVYQFDDTDKREVTVRSYNRTFLNLSIGKEIYPFSGADDPNRMFRIGMDVGGRYGSASMDFHEPGRHANDVVGGTFVGLYTDLLCPIHDNACVVILGLRGEWDYTWSDIRQVISDVQDINFLVTFGVRY